jgi:hypothetical protein
LERFANQEVVIRDPAWAEPFYRLARMSQVLGHQPALEAINQKILYTLEHALFSGTMGILWVCCKTILLSYCGLSAVSRTIENTGFLPSQK